MLGDFKFIFCMATFFSVGCVGGTAGTGDGSDGHNGGPDIIRNPGSTSVVVDANAERPVDIMPKARLANIATRMPRVGSRSLKAILEDSDTMFYDKLSIIPGYQDSFGDDRQLPTGMRPNSIDPEMINLAVRGGHEWIFQKDGLFHFPFGRTGDLTGDSFLIDFWRLPRDGDDLIPVAWWKRDPNGLTHRYEWMFPAETVLGEIQFIIDENGHWFPFEIRTRTRTLTGWKSQVFRPFPTAADLAAAVARKRNEKEEWRTAADVDALLAHLNDDSTLRPASLSSPQFEGAFPTIDGAVDNIPGLDDPQLLKELLLETPFQDAEGKIWKSNGSLKTFAATTEADFQIVPKGYDGGFMEVSDEACNICHRDAGRPFRDWYQPIIAYGELWGEDDSFTWHPFKTGEFVNSRGDVVDFNQNNREMRPDFVKGGVIAPYDASIHTARNYMKIPGEWKDYSY